ncbi:MAG TPA: lysylphosphatidylglycerol synthase domain-containing protein [Vicinamibacterales bacterium]|nr:lysylphosphatidylglycerol synthase domain-containing protein [Vicinamibacterales bacterium]
MTRSVLAKIVSARLVPAALTAAILLAVFRRIPLGRLLAAVEQADHGLFLAAMIPNTLFYVCWDTLVLTTAVRWFHGPVRYGELLPARAASYVVAFFNTNAGRGVLAAFLSRRLGLPFLQLGSTVLFLVLSEYLHLVAWATIGILQVTSDVPPELLWVPPGVAVLWLTVFAYFRLGATPRGARWLSAPREWSLLRTFRLAPAHRYGQVVLLRAPMFFVSLCLHAVAARAFGLDIPFTHLVAFLPVIFMIAALPITVARLGTTQAAWLFFFAPYAEAPRLLAFSLAAHLTFVATRSLVGLAFLPRAYRDLVRPADRATRIPERAPA